MSESTDENIKWLVSRMLDKDPKARITTKEILELDFVKKHIPVEYYLSLIPSDRAD